MTAPVAARPRTEVAAGTARSPRFTGRWLGPLAVTVLGGLLRFNELGRPNAFVFDETYYAKDAQSLLQFGYEQSFVDKADAKILAAEGVVDPSWWTGDASFIVHPPVGKWLIAAGEAGFGMTPFGWRVAVALFGTLTILLVARAVLRLTGSAVWGTVAGLLMAIDGVAIVMSRTAVLDGLLTFFVVAAFACLLVDRDWARSGRTPGSWWRPWRLLAAVCLGLALGVKWSALWFIAVFAVMTVLWEVSRRRREGQRLIPAFLRDAVPTAITMLGVALVVSVASWAGWFASADAWSRTFDPAGGIGGSLRSLLHYHSEMWGFHNNLTSDHSYESSAFGWLVQARPTSFYYSGDGVGCQAGQCSEAVTAIGNPLIWWAATLALFYQLWRWVAHRDWRSGAVLAGVAAGWLPWLMFPDRTIFAFYSVVFLPFMVAALTLSLAAFVGPSQASSPRFAGLRGRYGDRASDPGAPVGDGGEIPGDLGDAATIRRQSWRFTVVSAFLLACVAVSWFFYPVWSAELIDYQDWSQRMWFTSWV